MIDSTIVRAHQHAAALIKRGRMPRGLARFRGGLTTNIYVANEALGSPVCLIASHGQRHDIAFASVASARDMTSGSPTSWARRYR